MARTRFGVGRRDLVLGSGVKYYWDYIIYVYIYIYALMRILQQVLKYIVQQHYH